MRNLRNIVVGIDFSKQSENALLEAKRLAQRRSAKLHLINVVEDPGSGKLADVLGVDLKQLRKDAVAKNRELLKALVSKTDTKDVECKIVIRQGDPFKEIQNLLKDIRPGLLILGSRGTTSVSEGAGPLTIRCIRKVKPKVMIVRRAHKKPFKAVGAFVDFSKNSKDVIQQAAYIARTDRAKLHLFHVYLPPWRVPHYGSPARSYTPEIKERHKKKVIGKMQKILESFEAELDGMEVEYSLIESSEKIIGIDEFIEGVGVDFVVIGTRPRTGVRAVLLRTIAEHIIRTSPCSIMAVKS